MAKESGCESGGGGESWMDDLFSAYPLMRLVWCLLPGSHDSASYNILHLPGEGRPCVVDPAESRIVRSGLTPRRHIAGWSRTQTMDVYEQLCYGVRVLDFRVSVRVGEIKEEQEEEEFVLVHGAISITLKEGLAQVTRFLREQPKEVVILEINKVPGTRRETGDEKEGSGECMRGRALSEEIYEQVKEHAISRDPNHNQNGAILPQHGKDLSFQTFWGAGKNLLVLCDDARLHSGPRGAWIQNYHDYMHGCWADAVKLDRLKTIVREGRNFGNPGFRDEEGRRRDELLHYVSLTLTPRISTVLKGALLPWSRCFRVADKHYLREFLRPVCEVAARQWLREWEQETTREWEEFHCQLSRQEGHGDRDAEVETNTNLDSPPPFVNVVNMDFVQDTGLMEAVLEINKQRITRHLPNATIGPNREASTLQVDN
eukprot:Nk52_evm4s251 gene=Nk52_evmTU4s251